MLRARLSEALKAAMKSRDQCAVSTLRLILAALKDREIAARGKGGAEGIGDDEILDLLQKMIRQRRDSIEMYRQGNRQDLVDKEEAEIVVIQGFLPEQIGEDAMEAAVDEVIDELGAKTIKDMGRVMGTLKERYAGRMDFAKASTLAKQRLS